MQKSTFQGRYATIFHNILVDNLALHSATHWAGAWKVRKMVPINEQKSNQKLYSFQSCNSLNLSKSPSCWPSTYKIHPNWPLTCNVKFLQKLSNLGICPIFFNEINSQIHGFSVVYVFVVYEWLNSSYCLVFLSQSDEKIANFA